MMLLAHISDLHIKRPGALAYRRVDTAAHLARCVARLNALEPRPDAVLVTGDLTDFGDDDEYAHLKALLAPLAMPYYLLVGNHDDRAALRRAFPARVELQSGEFVQYALDLGPLRVIALDSQIPGASGGTLCDARLAWLADQLDAARDRPVIVALHHPPFACGHRPHGRDAARPGTRRAGSTRCCAAIRTSSACCAATCIGRCSRASAARSRRPCPRPRIRSRSICATAGLRRSRWSRPRSPCTAMRRAPGSRRITCTSTRAMGRIRSSSRRGR
ncbi:Ser/Thr protein phosphatase family protein [Burkholderia pseudomallei Pakistan 9]|nr:Ser/Thr protein phosphatase family protein [Burkholderia pseudomallei Pakistan 9]